MNTTAKHSVEERARELFARSCTEMDAATATRLRQVRARAVQPPSPRDVSLAWLPAGALAVCALALAVVWNHPLLPDQAGATNSSAPTLITTANDHTAPPDNADVALYSDLDFYRWLAAQPALAQRSRN